MTSRNLTSSTASVLTTALTPPTPTSSGGVLTTWPSTTYTLPTLTSWGSTPNGFGDLNVGNRIMQLVTSGSNGEKIVRGFLMGIAVGIILGGALCCWVPCFGRGRQERRERRQQRQQAERQARDQARLREGGQTDGQTTAASDPTEMQQTPSSSRPSQDAPAAGSSYMRLRWDRVWRQQQRESQ
ncbi:hypothetical protein NOR_05588 [Metarhizium rileyi]|uniref:Uncharacterized protein n=1 Tax=Metarhizium rileyi (strain RCEF 4871) TaxID=1649241 RepID=A0A167CBL5_METRR|nr:hypothetical protein NOR_05588 [Metarhizium rileyi RCEF 4871]TWU72375.1 hypothetical protein ED733_003901 [Metarhizium rileyi]